MSFRSFLAAGFVLFAACSANAQNLVTNGGFETGDFTGWTTVPAAAGSLFGVQEEIENTGTYGVFFAAPNGLPDTISQTIGTTPGAMYTFSFYLANGSVGSDLFIASFDGATVLTINPSTNEFGYTQYAYSVTASSASTAISFAGHDNRLAFYIDDISVTYVSGPSATVPEPGAAVAALAFGGLLGGPSVGKRRAR